MSVSLTLIDRITARLSDGKALPRPHFAPELSYGRHRGPAKPQSRRAAVAVTLYHCPDQGWVIPLTLRPLSLQHHGGQVCFPGGRVEADETVFQAALREFREEVGVDAKVIRCCGQLSPQYVYASDNLVHPIVAFIEYPEPWNPDPVEVAEVIPLPLSRLLQWLPAVVQNHSESLTQASVRSHPETGQSMPTHDVISHRGVISGGVEVDQLRFRTPAVTWLGHRIWGATVMILDQLAQVMHQAK